MLTNIKSSFILKQFLSFLNEKRKLELVKYNKNFQNILDINIINYMHFTGKYIKFEKQGKVKEYDYGDNIIYEGEYANGKRNGKGKEYIYNAIFIFEKINIKNQIYEKKSEEEEENMYYKDNENEYPELIFEGEFLNGLKWNGKMYLKDEVIFELNNGEGVIKLYYPNGCMKFEGKYKNGKINGEVNFYNEDGKIAFQKEYINGIKWNGKGYDKYTNISYEFENSNGKIKKYNSKGFLEFEGEYLNSQRTGKGKEYDKNGKLLYDGEYLNGKRNGKGKSFYDGELRFDGEYIYGFKRKGKEYKNGILEYEGNYLYNFPSNGKEYDEKGNIKYEYIQLINGNIKKKSTIKKVN